MRIFNWFMERRKKHLNNEIWVHLALVYGFNEMARKSETLGEKLGLRLLIAEEKKWLSKHDVHITESGNYATFSLPFGRMELTFRDSDWELMRKELAKHDAETMSPHVDHSDPISIRLRKALVRVGISETSIDRIVSGDDIESDYLTKSDMDLLGEINLCNVFGELLNAARVLEHFCREAPGRLPDRIATAFAIIALSKEFGKAVRDGDHDRINELMKLIHEQSDELKSITPTGVL